VTIKYYETVNHGNGDSLILLQQGMSILLSLCHHHSPVEVSRNWWEKLQWLTGWWFQICFIFFDIWNVIIPTDELHHFSEG
jgi:hypothetical protein